jgi:hypothetical protein
MDMDLDSSNWELDLEKRKRRRDYEFERDWRIETEAGLAKERKTSYSRTRGTKKYATTTRE